MKKKEIVGKHAGGIVVKELNKILANPEDDDEYKKENKKKKGEPEDLEKGEKGAEKKKGGWKLFGRKSAGEEGSDSDDE